MTKTLHPNHTDAESLVPDLSGKKEARREEAPAG